eukprot:1761761-Amphidinium_carterae.2
MEARSAVEWIRKTAAKAYRVEAGRVKREITQWAEDSLQHGLGAVHWATARKRAANLDREVLAGVLAAGDAQLGQAKAVVWGKLWAPQEVTTEQAEQLGS